MKTQSFVFVLVVVVLVFSSFVSSVAGQEPVGATVLYPNFSSTSWSPDGSKLAMIGGYFDYVNFVPEYGTFYSEAHCPDGQPQAAACYVQSQTNSPMILEGIWVYDFAGGSLTRWVDDGGVSTSELAWSPDGKNFALVVDDGASVRDLVVLPVPSKDAALPVDLSSGRVLASEVQEIAWLDAENVAILRSTTISKVNVITGEERLLHDFTWNFALRSISVTPEGGILFTMRDNGARMVKELNNGAISNKAEGGNEQVEGSHELVEPQQEAGIMLLLDLSHLGSDIVLIGTDGWHPETITGLNPALPVLSPDGKRFSYREHQFPSEEIYTSVVWVYNIETGEKTLLTSVELQPTEAAQ